MDFEGFGGYRHVQQKMEANQGSRMQALFENGCFMLC